MKDNKWENQYKNNILSLMPLKTKKEKNYVKDYMVSVNEFCMEFPNANYDDIEFWRTKKCCCSIFKRM